MKRRALPLVIVIPILAAAAAFSAEAISTSLSTSTEDGETFSNLGFADASCEDECHIATFSCSASAAISIELADIDAKHASRAITRETQQIIVSVGGKSFDYFIQEMQYQEMTGSWWLTAYTQDQNARTLAPTISTAKAITAKVGGQIVELPVDAKVKTWAAACK